ncbi:hypothetical protein WR25_14270 isoform B [Diploscapter pachys]|uniref:Uncharacterized protein n=1 Tax=Diploscapter pachys TaxID=2018661 RepID=A0A2A2LVM6_9BILA|nr:hypothetical protein WR25_14270 isoform B [Diploscapter pachys]
MSSPYHSPPYMPQGFSSSPSHSLSSHMYPNGPHQDQSLFSLPNSSPSPIYHTLTTISQPVPYPQYGIAPHSSNFFPTLGFSHPHQFSYPPPPIHSYHIPPPPPGFGPIPSSSSSPNPYLSPSHHSQSFFVPNSPPSPTYHNLTLPSSTVANPSNNLDLSISSLSSFSSLSTLSISSYHNHSSQNLSSSSRSSTSSKSSSCSVNSVSNIPLPHGSPPPASGPQTSFPAVTLPSKKGIHPVYQFRIPGSDKVYEFAWQRTYKNIDTYICSGCRAIPKVTGKSTGHLVSVKVSNNEFEKDPRTLPHLCQPKKTVTQLASRIGYDLTRNIRLNPHQFSGQNPKQLYQTAINEIKNTDFGSEVCSKDVQREFAKGEHHRKRHAISRAVNSVPDSKVTFLHVPDEYQVIDGEKFLQLKLDDLHLFYRKSTLKLAAEAKLNTLICDGVHNYHPAELGRKAQLYSLHAICGNAQSKPLVFAITSNKLSETYGVIFQHVASRLKRYDVKIDEVDVILDFELAAHKAAETVFNPERVKGCMFHYSMAVARNVASKGLRPFVEGKNKSPEIIRWITQLRALPMLPPNLIPKVEALKKIPVRRSHSASSKCLQFLDYYKNQWMDQKMVYKWNKWLVLVNRTTNMAESWHRALRSTIRCHHPSYQTLLEALKNEEIATNNFLFNRVQVRH